MDDDTRNTERSINRPQYYSEKFPGVAEDKGSGDEGLLSQQLGGVFRGIHLFHLRPIVQITCHS